MFTAALFGQNVGHLVHSVLKSSYVTVFIAQD